MLFLPPARREAELRENDEPFAPEKMSCRLSGRVVDGAGQPGIRLPTAGAAKCFAGAEQYARVRHPERLESCPGGSESAAREHSRGNRGGSL